MLKQYHFIKLLIIAYLYQHFSLLGSSPGATPTSLAILNVLLISLEIYRDSLPLGRNHLPGSIPRSQNLHYKRKET